MTASRKKRILLAFDGSFHAMESARYIGRIPAFQSMDIVLFHVFTKIPECYYDLEASTPMGSRMKEIRAWEAQQETEIQKALEKARHLLIEEGVPEAHIHVNMHERQKGIARDITSESKKGYAAVIVGRKGVSRIRDLVMGSVSAKLLEKLTFVPLIVVGRNAGAPRALVALDRSENSWRASEIAARMLGETDWDLTLASVVRGDITECIEEARSAMADVFERVTDRFVKSGIGRERIATRLISGAQSRAAVIVQKADQGGFGTIVVGRRGLSRVKDFFIGRVSNKVIQLARDQAVWVVS
jgi:nucleotide-binding universal stress UspA family protein